MRREGVEPSHLAAQASETCASANSATSAIFNKYKLLWTGCQLFKTVLKGRHRGLPLREQVFGGDSNPAATALKMVCFYFALPVVIFAVIMYTPTRRKCVRGSI